MLFIAVLFVACSSRPKSKAQSDLSFILDFKKKYNAVEVDSALRMQSYTILASKYLVEKDSPVILNRVEIVDVEKKGQSLFYCYT